LVLLAAAALAACGSSHVVPAPVLTLLPAAFEGGTLRRDERCLGPGQEAVASVFVHQRSVTFTLRGHAVPGSVLEVALGSTPIARQDLAGGGPVEHTYRVAPPPGKQQLRLSLPPGQTGELCFTQVALTQP
jgi:hypothetical protein